VLTACVAVVMASLVAGVSADEDAWITIPDCRLVAHAANDGDSFHVRGGGREYFVRLYFVDAPESSMQIPARVREQAEWFGTTETNVLHHGELAKTRAAAWLDRPFTLYTQMIDARGASRVQRVFAMVKVDDRYLCELLVENGLARIYGIRRNLHDGTFRWDYIRKLEALEKKAKAAKTGLWGGGV
jgi:endonuclease YncB( thermonuclease family)